MKLKSIISIIILSVFLISCTNINTSTKSNDEIMTENDIIFYVSNDDITGWETYNKNVNGDLIDIIEQLKLDEKSFIPKETKVLGIEVNNRIADINLSSEFDEPESNASTPVSYKIKSIVKTLCLNKNLNIDGVRFLINGEYVKSIGPMLTEGIIKE